MTDERAPEAPQLREAFDAFLSAHAPVLWSLPPVEEGWRYYQAGAAYGAGAERTKPAPPEAPRDERLLSAETLQAMRQTANRWALEYQLGKTIYVTEVRVLLDHIDALAAENARFVAALEDMVDLDPYGVDSADYWCIYCCEHGDKPEAIKHDPLCTWVRADAVLARRADGGA